MITNKILSTISAILDRTAAADAAAIAEAKEWLRHNGQRGDHRNARMIRLTVSATDEGAEAMRREALRAEVKRRAAGAARASSHITKLFADDIEFLCGQLACSLGQALSANFLVQYEYHLEDADGPVQGGDNPLMMPLIVAALRGMDKPGFKGTKVLAALKCL